MVPIAHPLSIFVREKFRRYTASPMIRQLKIADVSAEALRLRRNPSVSLSRI